jgi:hypothetical protein
MKRFIVKSTKQVKTVNKEKALKAIQVAINDVKNSVYSF